MTTKTNSDRLRVDPKETALLLAEPTHVESQARERAVEALFESQGCPALFLAKAAVLSAFAVGKQTALVVDAGYRGTTGESWFCFCGFGFVAGCVVCVLCCFRGAVCSVQAWCDDNRSAH